MDASGQLRDFIGHFRIEFCLFNRNDILDTQMRRPSKISSEKIKNSNV